MSLTKLHGCIHVGCQGWNYDDWVTGPAGGDRVFYPNGTRPPAMLEVYARAFETVEVDSTFYAIPAAQTVDGWNKRTPPKFTFSLKLPQAISHEHLLRASGRYILEEFCDRVRLLDEKLAVILVQMPPHFDASPENTRALKEFLALLPRDMRFSIEFRSRDWLTADATELLAKHGVALALVEGQWIPRELMFESAALQALDFAYVRWMGERDLTRFDSVQRPQDANLQLWSETLSEVCSRARDVYAYFSNFYEGYAPASANKLKRLSGQAVTEAADLEDQPSLF
ncbi:MAG: DUF72 domain-containing protein [Acidobacteria bacterium]|nr:DUF72 domain-containing protein [Acidobacteriota bacterium]